MGRHWPLPLILAGILSAAAIAVRVPALAGHSTISDSLFPEIASVLKSPRCQNCHTATGFPRQGDDRHAHRFDVVRGPGDHGAAGLHCSTCHADHNNAASGVPGAPKWGVAPIGQQWETLDDTALCRQIVSPETNGGRSLATLEAHMNEDPLVQWAWHPGRDAHGNSRTLPPIDQRRFHALVQTWIAGGAKCPA